MNDLFDQDTPAIRVLITDDSPLIGNILAKMLNVPDIHVVGQAANGHEAVRMAMRLRPNVIAMDIGTPGSDSLETTRQIMRIQPTPIVILSSAIHASDYNTAFEAMESGALTVIEKPKGLGVQDYEAVREHLLAAVKSMAGVHVTARYQDLPQADEIGPMTAMLHSYFIRSAEAIAIAASIGGPPVLMKILSSLPPDFSLPILIAQQIVPSFIDGLADWLNTRTPFRVRVARDGDGLEPGQVLLAPGNAHLIIEADKSVRLERSGTVSWQGPSATQLFESMAQVFGANAVGIMLSGAGDDGVDGLEKMGQAGAYIIAQDEASSTNFDMPRTAIERGIVDEVLTPTGIAIRLTKLHHHMQSKHQPQLSLNESHYQT